MTRQEIEEEFDDVLQEVELKRGFLTESGDRIKKVYIREPNSNDTLKVSKDKRITNEKDPFQNNLLASLIAYVEDSENEFRNMTVNETRKLKMSDQVTIVEAMSGELDAENFTD